MLTLFSDAYILLKANHIIFSCEDIPESSCQTTESLCRSQKSRASLYCCCLDFPFRKSAFSPDCSEQFSQSTHPDNPHKTPEAPASLSAFSRGCDMERAGKMCFMHELLCLLSKRRLFLCRWAVLPKNAPWCIASLIPSLLVLQDSGQVTATHDQSHLLLGNCTECGSVIYRFAAHGGFCLGLCSNGSFPQILEGNGQNQDIILTGLTSYYLLKH